MWPLNSFSSLSQTVWGFSEKNLETVFGIPFPPKKGYIHFCRPTPPFLKNVHVLQKQFFAVILENIVFFEKIVK